MQHPNGQRSVYAHLQRFDEQIEQYVLEQQYQKKTFGIELFPSPQQFKFNKGEVIALSGNSGSSFGPHLHFEIRNSNDEPLKVLRFGFDEILDHVPPVVQSVVLRTKSPTARINGEYGRVELPLIKTKSSYQVLEPILASGWVGIDLQAFDKADGVHNKYGIYDLALEVNGKTIHKHLIDQFSFFESRAIQTFTDYAHKKTHRQTFQHCYIENGNELPFFPLKQESDGKFFVEEGSTYEVKMRLTDVFGNQTLVQFTVKGASTQSLNQKKDEFPNYQLDENAFVFFHNNLLADEMVNVFSQGISYSLKPAYRKGRKNVYVWDMRDGIPDSLKLGEKIEKLHFKQTIPSTVPYFYNGDRLDITFGKGALYDTLYLQTQVFSDGFVIQDETVPLFKRIIVGFRPEKKVANKAKTRLYYKNNRGRLSYEGGRWQGDQILVSTREFGEYVLKEDNEKPSIELVRQANNQVVFRIGDDLSGVDKYEATLDGNWLLMKFDHRKDLIWSERLDKSKPLKGKLRVVVTDEVGNETIFEKTLN